jgi:hypothetical protein
METDNMSEPIIVKVISEAVGGSGGAGAKTGKDFDFFGELVKVAGGRSTMSAMFKGAAKALPVLGAAAVFAAPMYLLAKKMYDNSELMRGTMKAMNMAFGALGDAIMYGLWILHQMIFGETSTIYKGTGPGAAETTASNTKTFFSELWEDISDLQRVFSDPAGFFGDQWESLKETWNDIWNPDWDEIFDPKNIGLSLPEIDVSDLFSLKTFDIFSRLKIPTINISSLFGDKNVNRLDLFKWIKIPSIKVTDLISSTSFLTLKDYIKLPRINLGDMFNLTTKFDLTGHIKFPKINVKDLFDWSEEASKEFIKKLEKFSGIDIPGV